MSGWRGPAGAGGSPYAGEDYGGGLSVSGTARMTEHTEQLETDGERLRRLGTDGAAWAKDFAETFQHIYGTRLDPTPGDLVHVWFANAIEAGRSAGNKESHMTEHNDTETEPLLRYFSTAHLSAEPLRAVVEHYASTARWTVDNLLRSAERTVALRKLLEAKDAAVRAAVDAMQAAGEPVPPNRPDPALVCSVRAAANGGQCPGTIKLEGVAHRCILDAEPEHDEHLFSERESTQ